MVDGVQVGVNVVDDGGCAEDLVGKGFEGSKHLAARKGPLAKQNVLLGCLSIWYRQRVLQALFFILLILRSV